jgi:uracil-DNA glycosylase
MYHRATGFNKACKRCALSCGEAIPGQSASPLSEVKLVIVSAYPGSEEVKYGATLIPANDYVNAGAYLKSNLSLIFDVDKEIPDRYKPFDNFVFKTNALKCPSTPGHDLSEPIKACKTWLDLELKQLPKGVPILIAASQALTSLTLGMGGKYGINSDRGQIIMIKGHPCLCTYNPIEGLRYTPYEGPKDTPVEPVLGSIPWLFRQDLLHIKELVKEYINGNRVQ